MKIQETDRKRLRDVGLTILGIVGFFVVLIPFAFLGHRRYDLVVRNLSEEKVFLSVPELSIRDEVLERSEVRSVRLGFGSMEQKLCYMTFSKTPLGRIYSAQDVFRRDGVKGEAVVVEVRVPDR